MPRAESSRNPTDWLGARVFISYAREDRDLARMTFDALQKGSTSTPGWTALS